MTPLTPLPNPDAAEISWTHCPLGMALINTAGNICAVNPAFEDYLALPAAALLGMSEATLDALLAPQSLDHRRSETAAADVRAIHYINAAVAHRAPVQRLALIAEMLREPLASVYGFAELLLTQNYDEQTRLELTTTLLNQVEDVSNIINQHLDMTRDLP